MPTGHIRECEETTGHSRAYGRDACYCGFQKYPTVSRGAFIQTFSGRRFYPFDPRPEDVFIEDIAHSLSQLCRYAGHCNEFYSVAQHSIYISFMCDSADALWGLLHDAAEAFIADMPRPVKIHPDMVMYRETDHSITQAICQCFGLPELQPSSVTKADKEIVASERATLLKSTGEQWEGYERNEETRMIKIFPWPPRTAEAKFLARFRDLTREVA